MAKLGQPGLTVPQKQEMRERWLAGESIVAIARALGRSTRQIDRLRAEDGGYGPPRRRRSARVLTAAEREEISRERRDSGRSLRSVGDSRGFRWRSNWRLPARDT